MSNFFFVLGIGYTSELFNFFSNRFSLPGQPVDFPRRIDGLQESHEAMLNESFHAGFRLNEKTTLVFIVASLVLLGFGFVLLSVPNANAVMSSVENRFYGVASGTLSTMRMSGMVFSTGIALLIFSIYLGKVQITFEYYPLFLKCIKTAFIFFTVLCFGGCICLPCKR